MVALYNIFLVINITLVELLSKKFTFTVLLFYFISFKVILITVLNFQIHLNI